MSYVPSYLRSHFLAVIISFYTDFNQMLVMVLDHVTSGQNEHLVHISIRTEVLGRLKIQFGSYKSQAFKYLEDEIMFN